MEEIYREIAQLLDDRNLTSGIIRLGFENQYVHLGLMVTMSPICAQLVGSKNGSIFENE